ncbi:MAG: PAS domain S-box protein [Deltaproteobacteria bacterium]|nr:PAS domain S-box protein [Deltaproteobacteria bacterium]
MNIERPASNVEWEKMKKQTYDLEQRAAKLNIELKDKGKSPEIDLKEKEDAREDFHNILESLNVGVVVIDLKGEIITFNRAAENITGLFSEKVIGKEFDKVFDPNFFLNSHLDFKSLKDIQQNADVEAEIRRKGKNTFYVSLSISPVKNPEGEKIGIVLALQDITRLKKLEERSNRTDRLAAMGEIAVKIAHEIRNPLGSIELFATVLKKDLKDFEELKALAGHISSGVKSINNVISNLLLFIRPQQKPNFQAIDICDSLDDSLFFSSHLVNSDNGIDIITRYYSKPLMVYADSELLKQIFLNLILNAIQAMPHGGKLTISTRKLNGRSKKDFAEIRFADTGTGISKADMLRIFDPFFTTKKRGTGLGLAIVHNITEAHGGAVDINSSEGKGTVCTVTLPLVGS